MAATKIIVAYIVEIVGAKSDDYYGNTIDSAEVQPYRNDSRHLIEVAILVVIITAWFTYLYTVWQERSMETTTKIVEKEVTEVEIAAEPK